MSLPPHLKSSSGLPGIAAAAAGSGWPGAAGSEGRDESPAGGSETGAGRRHRPAARRLWLLLRRERRRGRRHQPRFHPQQVGVTWLGALAAVGLLAALSLWSGQRLIVAPLGASAVLLFGYPRSPLAQPRNLVLGNLLGVALVQLLGSGPLALALAVALTILLGQQLRCLHPPAGGLAFLAAWLGVPWSFLLFPVLSGSLLLVLLAWSFSRWVPGAMPYPLHWL